MMNMDPDKVICIDPGHGGSRDGAKYDWAEEDDLNLQVAYYLDYELRLEAFPTLLTRQRDIEPAPSLQADLNARVNLANTKGADFYISLHFDAFHDGTAKGMSIHLHPNASERTKLWAGMLSDRMKEHIKGRRHRGVKESDFHVLRHTKMPAVLIECEFLSNPESRKWIHEPENLRDLARSISAATVEFCRGPG